MEINRIPLATTLAALALTFLTAPNAKAVCGVPKPNATPSRFQTFVGQPLLLKSSVEPREEASIVGFWHVKFVSQGSGGAAPDGAEIDAGYSQWHSDHTEIMNSGGRSPLTGDFCLGVWEKVGERVYKLNHFAAAYDPTGTTLIGPANIKETVRLDPDGDSFVGEFSIDQYTEGGVQLVHLQGVITGTRIKVSTPPTGIF